MKGGWKKAVFLFVLVLPFIGFFVVKHLSDVNLRMPRRYVVESVRAGKNGDTVYHRMRDFSMVNQLGHSVGRNDLEGRVTLVDFFHTRGGEPSGRLSEVLKKIQDTYAKSASGLHILSVTTDPGHDSIPVLMNYAEKIGTNHTVWWFLRGDTQQVKDMAASDFNLPLERNDSSGILYSPVIVLLDKHQYVRGYYNVTDSARVLRCVHDISLLMLEKEGPAE